MPHLLQQPKIESKNGGGDAFSLKQLPLSFISREMFGGPYIMLKELLAIASGAEFLRFGNLNSAMERVGSNGTARKLESKTSLELTRFCFLPWPSLPVGS